MIKLSLFMIGILIGACITAVAFPVLHSVNSRQTIQLYQKHEIPTTIRYRIINGPATPGNISNWVSVGESQGIIPSCFTFVKDQNLSYANQSIFGHVPLPEEPWSIVIWDPRYEPYYDTSLDAFGGGSLGTTSFAIWMRSDLPDDKASIILSHELVHQFLEASYGYPLSFCFDENGGTIMGLDCSSLLADYGFDRNEMCDEIGMKYPCTTSFCKKCTNIQCMRGWNSGENCMECPDLCLVDGTGNWQREETRYYLNKFFPDICSRML